MSRDLFYYLSLKFYVTVDHSGQNKFDSKAGTTARAIETLMGQYFD